MELPADICRGFLRRAELQPEAPALKGRGGRGDVYSYRRAAQVVNQLAGSLREVAEAAGNRIGILSENCPEWPLAYLGILAAGKVVVPIDAALKPDEIVRIISDARLGAIFVSANFEGMVVERTTNLRVFSFESATSRNWRALLGKEASPVAAQKDDVAVLIYTSGTTGAPKVVMLTHGNLLANYEGVSDALQFDSRDIFLSVLPLHHTYEAMCGFLTPLLAGATVVYARSLKSNELLEDIGFNRITIMCGVPLLFEKMAHAIQRGVEQASRSQKVLFKLLYLLSGVGWKLGYKWGRTLFAPIRRKAGLSTIRMFVSGGAPLPPSIARFYNYLGLDFLQGYGMTECSPVISTNRPDSIQFGSVGPPLGNLDVRIHEPDSSGIGEIVVRGASITPGYLNNPEKTAELVRESWLFTGDIGRLKDGHLWITGRRKLVIVSAAGKNIYPEELEERLLASPYVLESIVYGRKKENKQGEEVCALVVPDLEQFRGRLKWEGAEPDLGEVRQQLASEIEAVNAEVADYKRISRFDISLKELEKTSAKKVKRHLYAGQPNENQIN
jgi:long-chain acyl-CoA synthetase